MKRSKALKARSPEGKTVLHAAVMGGSIEIIETILKSGAKANVKDNYGVSPLFLASVLGHGEAVRILLEHGAEVSGKDAQNFCYWCI